MSEPSNTGPAAKPTKGKSKSDQTLKDLRAAARKEAFSRIASRRLNACLKQLSLLRNCANGASYTYSADQAHKLMSKLSEGVESVRRAFSDKELAQDKVQL